VEKIALTRVIYWCTLINSIAVIVSYRDDWLKYFNFHSEVSSMFVAIFIANHFISDKIFSYLLTTYENIISRGREFICDQYSQKHDEAGSKSLEETLLLLFFANKADYYVDWLYAAIKLHHPTLQARISALKEGYQSDCSLNDPLLE
jgi:Zn-dependent protease with chaperone function